MDMRGRNYYYDWQIYGNSDSRGYDYRYHDAEYSMEEKRPKAQSPELSSTPKLISQFGGLGIFEFIASYYSQRVLADPLLNMVYGGVSNEQGFVLNVGLLLFCLSDNFKCGDKYREEMVDKARENPTLIEHCRLGLMKEQYYFDRLFHYLMESVSVCRSRKSILRLVSRFAMLRVILQELDQASLATIREEEYDDNMLETEMDSDTSSSSFDEDKAANE